MHLKRLEIQGYKSFAAKTTLEFDPGITAIVGPNGSGKSNITDALRWVLGESAGKIMRARRLEDVIFAGSDKRAPAGLAEVRVTFNNEDGWLPLEFSEVVVTRRVARDGESEFLININKVRLRDLQDLFARSGLGPSTYAIMGQGLIDEVLRLRPEERRALIEEVADVRRHRLRMEESRRKREEARENLERARLLLDEIGPRLRSLERQAKRALHYGELQAELQRALRTWYAREWCRLQGDLSVHRAAYARRQAEQESATQALQAAESALAAWERDLHAARERRERVRAEQQRGAEQVQRLEQEQAVLHERRRLLAARAEELRHDLTALDAGAADLPTEPIATEQVASTETTVAQARAALTEAEAALAVIDAEHDGLRARAVAAGERLARLQAGEHEIEVRLYRVRAELEQLMPQGAPRQQRLATLRESLHHAEAAAAAAAETAAAAGRDAADAREQRERLAQRYYAAAAYLRNLELSRADRERRLARARDRLQLLKELQAESEGMRQGLRALFGSRGAPRGGDPSGIPGVLGVLRHAVRAPRGLEKAIEAALEDYLDGVVFHTTDDALQIIAALIKERAGRIVALPLDGVRPRSPVALQPEPGVIGIASTLVQCDDRYRGLIDTVLGRTIVTEDLESAQRMLKRGLGNVVTRDGQLLRTIGTIVGGEVAPEGAFTRESELQSLPQEIEELERSLADSARVEERQAELRQLELDLAQAERDSEQGAAVRAAALDEAAVRRADVARLQGDLHTIEEEALRAEQRRLALTAEEAALQAERRAGEEERRRTEQERPDPAALEAVAQRRHAQARVVGEAAARLSAAAGEHATLQAALQARAAAIAQLQQQRQVRAAQLIGTEREAAELENRSAQLERDLTEARRARDTAGDGGPESARLADLSAREPAMHEAVQTAQRALLTCERALLGAEAAVHESEAAGRRLRDQLSADGFLVTDAGVIASADAPAGAPPALAFARAGTAGASERGEPPGAANGQGAGPPIAAPAANTDVLPPEEEDDPSLSEEQLRARIDDLRAQLRRLGNVNPDAAAEYQEIKERHDFLDGQVQDLEGAEQRLLAAEAELAALIRDRFQESFQAVDTQFRRYFQTMFRGGSAKLLLTEENDWENGGVDLAAQPPGKRLESLAMLSGGERSLIAIALLFAMLEISPAPFCVLDEVDAALDEANVGRFVAALKQLAHRSQFVLITHNRRTIEQADSIYGITMGEDSASRVLSVRLADLNLEN